MNRIDAVWYKRRWARVVLYSLCALLLAVFAVLLLGPVIRNLSSVAAYIAGSVMGIVAESGAIILAEWRSLRELD